MKNVNVTELEETPAAAKAAGSRYYYTGKPCKAHGHVCVRLAANNCCYECQKLRSNAANKKRAAAKKAGTYVKPEKKKKVVTEQINKVSKPMSEQSEWEQAVARVYSRQSKW